MSVNIEKILENYIYYINGRNITGKGTDIHQALIDAKQIVLEVEQLQDFWFENTDVDKVEHAKKLHELSKGLQEVVKVKTLQDIWNNLSQMEMKPESKIPEKEASWRKRDLLADISTFYLRFEKASGKFTESLECVDPEESTESFESKTEDFRLHATNLAETMDDLDYRMSTLMHLIDPISRNKLILEICPYTKASLIAERAAVIIEQVADKPGFQEMIRLIRRMGIVLNETKFMIFSERDERRYDIIQRIAKFRSHYKKDKISKGRLSELVEKVDKLREYIHKQRRLGVQVAMQYNSAYKKIWKKRRTHDFSSVEHEATLVETTYFFRDICYVIEVILERFYKIRLLVDEVWNAL